MIILTLLLVITFTAGGSSIVIFPEKLQGHESELFYHFQPKSSASDNLEAQGDTRSKTEHGMYRNDEQKLDDDAKHNSYRVEKNEREENTEDNEYDEPILEKNREKQTVEGYETDSSDEDVTSNKSGHLENVDDVKEEERDNNSEQEKDNLINNEKDSEEAYVDDDSGEDYEKHNENYEDSEERDAFKWPDESEWYGKFGRYKGFDDFGDKFHSGDGKFGWYGKFGRLADYSSIGGHTGYGCLELGHGEYC